MASLFKPSYTVKDPATGKKSKRKAKRWYGQFKDHNRGWVRVPLCTDKTAAQAMLNALVRKAELAQVGIVDPFEGHAKTPLVKHLDEFEKNLLDRGNTRAHVDLVVARAKRIIDGCGYTFTCDISASRVDGFLADLRNGKERLSIQTSNFYLQAIKQFCRWLMRDGRTATNPVEFLQGGNVKLDVRRVRRELSEEEIALLLKAARAGDVCCRLTGDQRFMLYATALGTGLRASELRSLTRESFDLDSDPPTVTILAQNEKARRGDTLPLPPDLVDLLRPWLAQNAPDAPLWPGKWAQHKQGGKMVERDLKAARAVWIDAAKNDAAEQKRRKESPFLEYRTSDNESADFHSLRHTFLSRLGRAGVPAKVMQRLARHSTVELTLGRYTHASLYDLAAAATKLPRLPVEEQDAAGLKAG
ncbi:MAG: tyrosine-type recombinase/integrase [Planctomycetaceae bacterium]